MFYLSNLTEHAELCNSPGPWSRMQYFEADVIKSILFCIETISLFSHIVHLYEKCPHLIVYISYDIYIYLCFDREKWVRKWSTYIHKSCLWIVHFFGENFYAEVNVCITSLYSLLPPLLQRIQIEEVELVLIASNWLHVLWFSDIPHQYLEGLTVIGTRWLVSTPSPRASPLGRIPKDGPTGHCSANPSGGTDSYSYCWRLF